MAWLATAVSFDQLTLESDGVAVASSDAMQP